MKSKIEKKKKKNIKLTKFTKNKLTFKLKTNLQKIITISNYKKKNN